MAVWFAFADAIVQTVFGHGRHAALLGIVTVEYADHDEHTTKAPRHPNAPIRASSTRGAPEKLYDNTVPTIAAARPRFTIYYFMTMLFDDMVSTPCPKKRMPKNPIETSRNGCIHDHTAGNTRANTAAAASIRVIAMSTAPSPTAETPAMTLDP